MRAAVPSWPTAIRSLFSHPPCIRLSRAVCGEGNVPANPNPRSCSGSSDLGGQSGEAFSGAASHDVEDGEEGTDFSEGSRRRSRTREIRLVADHMFDILLQDGRGISARAELEKLQRRVSPELVREVLLRIIKFVDHSNKPQCAKLGLKFFIWSGEQKDYQHTSNAYNLMLKIFSKCEEVKAMWRLVDDMIQSELPTTALTLNILVSSCNDTVIGRKLVERFVKSKAFNFRPSKRAFNAILHSLITIDEYRLVEWVHQKMLLDGHSPDTLTYNLVMLAKYRLGKLDEFHRMLDEMGKKGFAPDLHTYNILLHVLGKGDKPLAALKLLDYMRDVGYHPRVLHFTTLIDGLSRAGNMDACQYFFDEMFKRGCEPDVVAYTVLITGYVVANEFDKAQILFDEMINRGQLPNVLTYNSMIRGLCLSGKCDEACCMLKDVENKGYVLNPFVYKTLIAKLRSTGKYSEADEIIKRMEEKGYHAHLSSRFMGYWRK